VAERLVGEESRARARAGRPVPREVRIPAQEVLRTDCTVAYHRRGSYEGAARRLELDRRTVKARVDETLLEELRGASPVARSPRRSGAARPA